MDDLIARFTQRAEAVAAVVRPAADLAEAFAYAAGLTASQGGACLAAPGWEMEHHQALGEACAHAGVELITSGLRAEVGRFHTGLTTAQWGVAETGTIIVDSHDEQVRLASMLAETHVAILPKANLREDLFALESEMAAILAAAPGYMANITGPSRTGDIELVLTLGAHGPRQLHILLLEDAS
ncbi:MAG: LUD domain-containing protein [Desulfarculaceae bacterium]|nr:LUD domain-containing protein [Desulfarculaceae bacterium]